MAKKMMGQFDDIVELAAKFVEQQKGVWDHTAWMNFLNEVKEMGFEMTDDLKSYLGSLLEAMKKFYSASTATENINKAMTGIAEDTVSFIKKTKGMWDHSAWEDYLSEVQKKGLNVTDETMKYLGGILESSKELYVFPPVSSKMMAKTFLKKQKES
ncbi:MAG: hypothetical protein HQK89_18080 [Nitrospirae bacterium]|nr:hypothetical protein [Nitrospirota bacterium]